MSKNLYETVLDQLGIDIIEGAIPAGARLVLSDIEERFAVSRTLARDVVKVLESLGLLVTRRRAGVIVQPQSSWQLLDPEVIAWRLRGTGRDRQLTSLVDVREAVEPRAAALAAGAASAGDGARLVELSARMTALGQRGLGRSEAYLEADIEFHSLLLRASGNEMFTAMSGMIEAVLRGRSQLGMTPKRPDAGALLAHEQIADAVLGQDAQRAEEVSRSLFTIIRGEVVQGGFGGPRPAEPDAADRPFG